MINYLKILAELSKVRITVVVTVTTILGYLMQNRGLDAGAIGPTFGLFLLACASAILNQYQESGIDAKMPRTQNRPIPSGRISSKSAFLHGLIFAIVGSIIILYTSNFMAMQLGILALIWYNGIYTPLKKKTAFAVIPGSVIGSLPPMVGYAAAGGNVTDIEILVVAFFMFIWQVPHFWLLLLKFGKQYEEAGFPSLTQIYSVEQIKRVTFVWSLGTAVTALFIPFFHIISNLYANLILVAGTVYFIVLFFRLILPGNPDFNIKKYFIFINVYLLLIVLTISIDVYLP